MDKRNNSRGSGRAQSSVIGVVLLTAVLIITVSTIGVFFLGTISDQADASEPLVDVNVTLTNETVAVRQVAGDTVDLDDLTLVLSKGSTTERYAFDAANVSASGDGQFAPGETFARNHSLGSGAFRVRVYHTASNSLLHSERLDAYGEARTVATLATTPTSRHSTPSSPARSNNPVDGVAEHDGFGVE